MGKVAATSGSRRKGCPLPAAGSPSQSPSVTALPKGEPLAWRYSFRLNCKVCGFARASPFGRGGIASAMTERARPLRGGGTPSVCSRWSQPPVPHSVADATSLPDRGESVQGDGFSGGEKVSGSAIRRPLGGAGCERSEQTEGVLGLTACALSVKPCRA